MAADMIAISLRDRATLARVADAEQERQVAHYKAAKAPRATIDEVDFGWAYIALWFRGGIDSPPDAAAILAQAKAAAALARKHYSDDHPKAAHMFGLIVIADQLAQGLGRYSGQPIAGPA